MFLVWPTIGSRTDKELSRNCESKQSYLPANPRRQRTVTSVFDLLTLESMHAERLPYMCTKFAVDSSSRFPFTAWTHRDTDRQRPTAGVGEGRLMKLL